MMRESCIMDIKLSDCGYILVFMIVITFKDASTTHLLFGIEDKFQTNGMDSLEKMISDNQTMVYATNNSDFLDFKYIIKVCNYMSHNHDLLYSISLSQCYPEVNPTELFAHHAHLPVLSLTKPCYVNVTGQKQRLYPLRSPYSVNKQVSIPNPSLVMAELVLQSGWLETIIIVDQHLGVYPEVEHLLTYLAYGNVKFTLFHIYNHFDIIQVVGQINDWKSVENTVPHIVMCNLNNTLSILEQANILGMRRIEYRWLVYNKAGYSHLIPHLVASDNIALLTLNMESTKKLWNTVYENIKTLHESIHERAQNETSMVVNNNSGYHAKCKSKITSSLRNRILANMEKLDSALINNSTSEAIYEVKSSITRQSGVPGMEQVATWEHNSAELSMQQLLFPNAFNGFNQRVFTVASLEYSFFQQKVVNADGNVTWTGLTFQLLDELAKELNFSYVVTEPEDGQWGIENLDGNWTGMIGMVIKQEVDFAAAGFSVTSQRDLVVDFPSPYFHDQSVVVIRRPDEQNRLFLYIYPFQWKVWALTVGSICLCGPLLWLFTLWSPFYQTHGNPWKSRHGLLHLDNALIYIFGAFFQQGGQFMPASQSGRILVGCFWFFAIVVMATYTGNLIAFLAVSTVDMPFDTLSQMIGQASMSWGPAEGVAMVMLFRDANFEPYTSVNDGMELVPSYGEGLRRVKEGDFGFISEKSWYNAEAAADQDCILAMMKEEFYPTNYAWALQTGAPYLKMFSDKINKIRESGLLHKWIKDWTPKNLHCKGLGPITQARTATVIDFQGALFLLVLGVGVGILLLFAELGVDRLRKMRKKSQNKNNHETTTQEQNGIPQNSNHHANGHHVNGHLSGISFSMTEQRTDSTSSRLDLLNYYNP